MLPVNNSYLCRTIFSSLYYSFSTAPRHTKHCFSSGTLLTMKNGSFIPMSEASMGLEVLSYSYRKSSFVFSPIVWIPHAANTESALFVQINTRNGLTLTLTKQHLLPSGSCDASTHSYSLKRADRIRPNDCLHSARGVTAVTSVRYTRGNGLYTVITMESFIVVNGLVASPFAVNHYLPDAFYSFHRLVHWSGLSETRGIAAALDAVTDTADQLIGLLHSSLPTILNLESF